MLSFSVQYYYHPRLLSLSSQSFTTAAITEDWKGETCSDDDLHEPIVKLKRPKKKIRLAKDSK
ncbi:hypothetical protein HN873_063832, partial [Arachis hypogaea]